MLELELSRLNREHLKANLAFPDEFAPFVLKSHATQVRHKSTDVVDVWRCLEVARAAGAQPEQFATPDEVAATAIVRALFSQRRGDGMKTLVAEQSLSAEAADQRFTRIRALIDRVLGAG